MKLHYSVQFSLIQRFITSVFFLLRYSHNIKVSF
nr:MAG TPA: hypothetical protein [Caudoviricetes sp.]